LFRDGCPGGESPGQISARADHVLSRLRAIKQDLLIFSSGRWLGLEPAAGRFFDLHTASVSVLGYENTLSHPVIHFWHDTGHLDQQTNPI
jgi:broad specificity phosphatase PhoE